MPQPETAELSTKCPFGFPNLLHNVKHTWKIQTIKLGDPFNVYMYADYGCMWNIYPHTIIGFYVHHSNILTGIDLGMSK